MVRSLHLSTDPKAQDSYESPVQPASLDLHIGHIYDTGDDAEGRQRYHLSLKPGQTTIVMTREELSFPNNVGALGFAPTSIWEAGLLMTNAGHVDPGFRGKLKYTLINMGTRPYALKRHLKIATLVVFELENPARTGWFDRHGQKNAGEPGAQSLQSLAKDFMDFEGRAERRIDEKVAEVDRKKTFWLKSLTASPV